MFPEGRILEMLMIGAIALIVVGPKDLPILMRRVGQFVGKMRGMANEFRASFDELARQSELDELRKEVEALRTGHQTAINTFNPLGDDHVTATFGEIEQHPTGNPVEALPPVQMTALPAPAPEIAPDPAPAKPKAPRKPRAKTAVSPEVAPAAKVTKPRKSAKAASSAS